MSGSSTETGGDFETVAVDHAPTKASSYAAVAAAVVAAVTSAPFAILALPLGIGGIGILGAGLFRSNGSRTWVTIGAASLFLSVLIAGSYGTPTELLLVSMIATVLAWNFGLNAIGLGEQIGRHSRTRRAEVIHGTVATIVAIAAGIVGYSVFALGSGGQPVGALGMLLFAIVFLAWAIRR